MKTAAEIRGARQEAEEATRKSLVEWVLAILEEASEDMFRRYIIRYRLGRAENEGIDSFIEVIKDTEKYPEVTEKLKKSGLEVKIEEVANGTKNIYLEA